MTTITSDTESAKRYATQLANAYQNLAAVEEVTKDTSTELQGNTRHHAVIDQALSFVRKITVSVEAASENLHSVASDFEAVDQAEAEHFGGRT